MPLVGALRFSNIFSEMPSPFLLQFVFKNSVSILCKLYSFNWYKFLITVLFFSYMACYNAGILSPH